MTTATSQESSESRQTVLPAFKRCLPCASSTGRKMRWGVWSKHDRDWMQLLEVMYEARHRQNPSPLAEGARYRIPCIIHHIWLGGELPQSFARVREGWRSKHVGWEMRLWTDADVEEFDMENRDAYDAALNFGEKSDILRYEVLLRYGGLYIDVDFYCLRPFDEMHKRYDFFTGLSNTGTFELNNGLVGCSRGHPIMRRIVSRVGVSCRLPPLVNKTRYSQSGIQESSDLAAAASGADVTPISSESARMPLSATATKLAGATIVGTAGAVEDPMVVLMSALGHRKDNEQGKKGILASFLGDEERLRVAEAAQEKPAGAMATIAKTGPGMFTLAVMEWLTEEAGAKAYSDPFSVSGHDGSVSIGAQSGEANACIAASPGEYRTVSRDAHGVMVLPPSYFYPIPNIVKKDLTGDGRMAGIIDRAGHYFSGESLAAHLWARSWQRVA